MRIKGWDKFQHYQSGRGAPPWIKLYRDLLNDKEWFLLDGDTSKFLVSLWILCAETDGIIPDMQTLSFRLRIDEKKITKLISNCKHWIISDASDMLAECYQVAIAETETETETETYISPNNFIEFWNAYPKKVGKGAAEKSWLKEKPNIDLVLNALYWQVESDQWQKNEGQFIPNPATYINQKRWQDEPQKAITF